MADLNDTVLLSNAVTQLQDLPPALQRSLKLMGTLDQQLQQRLERYKQYSAQHIKALNTKPPQKAATTTTPAKTESSSTDAATASSSSAAAADSTPSTTAATATTAVATSSSSTTGTPITSSSPPKQHSGLTIPPYYHDYIDVEAIELQLAGERDELTKLAARKQSILLEACTALDSHTRKLDTSIRKYESKIRKVYNYDVGVAPVDRKRLVNAGKPSIPLDAESRQLQYKLQNIYRLEIEKLTALMNNTNANTATNGVGEEVYCTCRRVSFGQMIGCDDDDCKYQWFHFGCVDIETKPRGKWFCADCQARHAKQRQQQREKDKAAAADSDGPKAKRQKG